LLFDDPKILCDRNIGSMPVVADQQSRKLVGMITDRDLCCSVIAEGMDPKTTQIDKLLTLAPLTCRDGENIETCERLMQEHQVRRIPIVDAEDRVIGIVSQADLALKDKTRKSIEDGSGNLEGFPAFDRSLKSRLRRPPRGPPWRSSQTIRRRSPCIYLPL
jgi:CBS-domain-containing membrane protein